MPRTPKNTVALNLITPTLGNLIALSRTLTGREPTPEEIAKGRAILDAGAGR